MSKILVSLPQVVIEDVKTTKSPKLPWKLRTVLCGMDFHKLEAVCFGPENIFLKLYITQVKDKLWDNRIGYKLS